MLIVPSRSARDKRNRYCAIGKIRYECSDGAGAPEGKLLYVKACLNGTEPADILNYASFDPVFPQQGTEQLWFDESQFESYRRLGAHTIEQIVAAAPPIGDGSPIQALVEAASAYIGSTPAVRFVGWPKASQFGGTIHGKVGGQNASLNWNLEQS